jgi:hypothetical protein
MIMLDTTEEIQQKQYDIIMSKSMEERLLIGFATVDFARAIAESSIRQANPGISAADLKIAVFKRFYSNQFSEEVMDKIIASMSLFYSAKG